MPEQDKFGGVYNFYENLKDLLSDDINYFYFGAIRNNINNKKILFFIYLLSFLKRVYVSKSNVIILNTSLNLNAVIRDSIYLLIAKLLRKEVIVFWRGWNFDNVKYLKFPYSIITWLLLKPDKSIVLYSEIGNVLRDFGHKNNIYNLTTTVSDSAFNYMLEEREHENFNLIFMSRVEIYKGVNELLDAYSILKEKYPNIKLTIAGNGGELDTLINKVRDFNIKDVTFSGYVTGNEKYKLLADSDLFVFPSYSEGMPNAVLEAMAMGLPIVTTKVGGLNDFFIEDRMGAFVEIKNVNSLVQEIEALYLNVNKRKSISKDNIKFASINFKKSIVYNKLKDIINI